MNLKNVEESIYSLADIYTWNEKMQFLSHFIMCMHHYNTSVHSQWRLRYHTGICQEGVKQTMNAYSRYQIQECDWNQVLQNTKKECEQQEHTVWWDEESNSTLLHYKN